MSPLQYQKPIRLQEARRPMVSESYDAAEAGYKVGYDDASHFNREYKRHFGEPPMRDIERLREVPARVPEQAQSRLPHAGASLPAYAVHRFRSSSRGR